MSATKKCLKPEIVVILKINAIMSTALEDHIIVWEIPAFIQLL